MNHIPGTPKKRVFTSKWFVEAMSSVPPLVVASVGTYRFLQDAATQSLALWSGLAAVWLGGASVLKVVAARVQDKADHDAKDHRDLRAAMHVLHATVAHICKLDQATAGQQLRCTVHRVVPPKDQPEQLEQIVNYVGGDGLGAGRTFSIRAGVTGKAARERTPYMYHRVSGDDAECRKELKEAWGYTDKDLKTLTMGRLSAFAIPVVDATGQHAVGVIYFDSSEKSLFRDQRRQAAIVSACGGLSKYISERYST